MRPGRIEVHVNGQRTGPPDGDGGEERTPRIDVLTSDAEREKEAEESVNGGGQRHCQTVWGGKTVGRHGGTQCASEQHSAVGQEEERAPEDGRSKGEMIFEMARGRAKLGLEVPIFVKPRAPETGVGVAVVVFEI